MASGSGTEPDHFLETECHKCGNGLGRKWGGHLSPEVDPERIRAAGRLKPENKGNRHGRRAQSQPFLEGLMGRQRKNDNTERFLSRKEIAEIRGLSVDFIRKNFKSIEHDFGYRTKKYLLSEVDDLLRQKKQAG